MYIRNKPAFAYKKVITEEESIINEWETEKHVPEKLNNIKAVDITIILAYAQIAEKKIWEIFSCFFFPPWQCWAAFVNNKW